MNQLTFEETTIGDQLADFLFTCITNENETRFADCRTTERGLEILSKAIKQMATPVSSVIID